MAKNEAKKNQNRTATIEKHLPQIEPVVEAKVEEAQALELPRFEKKGTHRQDTVTLSEYTDMELILPDFQRSDNAWKADKQQKLIECLLQGKPMPNILLGTFDGAVADKWILIDGLQRTTALERFVNEYSEHEDLLEQLLNTPINVTYFTAKDFDTLMETFVDYNDATPLSLSQRKKPQLAKDTLRVLNVIARFLAKEMPNISTSTDKLSYMLATMLLKKERATTSDASCFKELVKLDESTTAQYDDASLSITLASFKATYESLPIDTQKAWKAPYKLIQLFNIVSKGHNHKFVSHVISGLDVNSKDISYPGIVTMEAKKIDGEMVYTQGKKQKMSMLTAFADRRNTPKQTYYRTQLLEAYFNDKLGIEAPISQEEKAMKEAAEAIRLQMMASPNTEASA